MKNILSLLISVALLSSCGKETFYDKFVPEIMYYQNADVENADFKSITLARGVTQYSLKARVSAPMKLKDIKVYKGDQVLQTYSDFQLSPNVYKVNYAVTGVTAQTVVRIVAVDADNKTSTKDFTINVTP